MIIETANSTYTITPFPIGTMTSTNPRYAGPEEVEVLRAVEGRSAVIKAPTAKRPHRVIITSAVQRMSA